jgi:hypothetical protein
LLAVALVAGIGLSTTGCVEQAQLPSDCTQAAVTRNAKLTADGLQPRNIDVCRGQQVTIAVEIGADGVLHIHGYDEQAKEVRVGQTVTFAFPAVRSGQFVIELHTTEAPGGLNMGVFTVHEP